MIHPAPQVTYHLPASALFRPLRPVERIAGATGRTTKGAKRRLEDLRDELEVVTRECVEAGKPEQAIRVMVPAWALLEGIPSPSLGAADVKEAGADGREDVRWAEYIAAGMTDAAWLQYERAGIYDIACILGKLAAGRRKHGRTA